MDHVVYLDAKSEEKQKILALQKAMIIRGAAGRKMPYGRVHQGDALYFVNNNGEAQVSVSARVKEVIQCGPLTPEESARLVTQYQDQLVLTDRQLARWSGKRYLVFIALCEVQSISPFSINKDDFTGMDDWLPVGDISSLKK